MRKKLDYLFVILRKTLFYNVYQPVLFTHMLKLHSETFLFGRQKNSQKTNNTKFIALNVILNYARTILNLLLIERDFFGHIIG